ncbi:basal body-orientation factor 1-like isoform X2 [Betta splendens]|uniref:Basal body-orientation factor 1 n=1 Tax=Betta splendens TaxID=158456 RepID=A0A9W2XK26_BETSP|nr:basal body-orientation factor 1-like isoform X2 [Betta splendens]
MTPKKKVAKVKKAKAGKGKKDGKHDSKPDREVEMEKAKANAAVWELRLKVTEESLAQYQESYHKLARANEQLAEQLYRAEKDSVAITGFFKKRDEAKEEKVEDYTLQISEMKELFQKKASDFNMIQDGMKQMKEFEIRKEQIEQELSDIRESMANTNKEHRENLNKMEYKFLEEKARLEKEAEQMITLAQEQAHKEAIVQLDDAARSVFKENVRLNEALKYHIRETEELLKMTNALEKQNALLALDKNTADLLVKKNVAEMKAQREELHKLRAKVATLEKALKQKAEKQERAEMEEQKMLQVRSQAGGVELDKLQKVLAMREKELGHIKRLASTIVEQRKELEQFFHEALDHVREEIKASRLQYKKEALQAYRSRMRDAAAGKIKFPPIRTFSNTSHSTNSVYADMEAATTWTHQPGSKVRISELTWEQKEQVLSLLFAKMNGHKERKSIQHLDLTATSKKIPTDELKRSPRRQPSSLRRLTPFSPQTQTARRIYTPHDLGVASALHVTLLGLFASALSFSQSVTGAYS